MKPYIAAIMVVVFLLCIAAFIEKSLVNKNVNHELYDAVTTYQEKQITKKKEAWEKLSATIDDIKKLNYTVTVNNESKHFSFLYDGRNYVVKVTDGGYYKIVKCAVIINDTVYPGYECDFGCHRMLIDGLTTIFTGGMLFYEIPFNKTKE